MSDLTIKYINGISGYKFKIPSYQRGYKWRKAQVEQLLKDLYEHYQSNNTFYCLQPLVVKKDNDYYKVIDGQQRLTTIYMILKYLESSISYELSYESREKSKEFLEKIDEKINSENIDNIDFHYMVKAYNTIKKYFEDNKNAFENIKELLKGESDKNNKNVGFIWYEIDDNDTQNSDKEYEIFSRLNIGKIELTNAELIKALFLKTWPDESDQQLLKVKHIQISNEWDSIENTLQNDSFWYFINDDKKNYINRIEYIFDIIKNNLDNKKEIRYTFNEYYNDFFENSENNIKFIIDIKWQEVKDIMYIFDYFYNDLELFHLIGFIMCFNIKSIKYIIDEYNRAETKYDFKKSIKKIIYKNIKNKIHDNNHKLTLDYIEYKDKYIIKKILLLFNLIIIIKNKSVIKFPFDEFKKNSWDIEHIHSQATEEDITSKDNWFKMIKNFFNIDINNDDDTENDDYKKIYEIDEYIKKYEQSKSNDDFNELFSLVKDYFNFDDNFENINSIGNLALLDYETNRSYKNAWFPFKRKTILEKDSKGYFIPIATKNVFTKVYSSALTNLFHWSDEDADAYQKEIEKTIKEYFEEI
ncbi:DUF262 domain-containing protein [uncultured Brachyspira sp.]|uniref:DUF262 domain-containing protein n=1 Tax=uncultured Brachyspira sp. TaxID=221953 RepID=UPI002625A8EC|nr:DUF262 domain-containing protein [uncultured Brachyspira sp.]